MMQINLIGLEYQAQDRVILTVDVMLDHGILTYELDYNPVDFFGMSIPEMQEVITAGVRNILASREQLSQLLDNPFEVAGGETRKKAFG